MLLYRLCPSSCQVKFRQVGEWVRHLVARASLRYPPLSVDKMRDEDDLDVDEIFAFHGFQGKIILVSYNCMVQHK